MSDSVRPHTPQPTRLPCPWDSPGQNTGVDCHFSLQCMKVKSESEVAQSCLTLSNPMDRSPPGSSVHGIFQARVLEWGAIAFSEHIYTTMYEIRSDQLLSHVRLFATPWTAAPQAPPSVGFSRQKYWSGVPLPSPMEYYSAIKKNKILLFAATWMKLEMIVLSEVSQMQKDKYCVISLTCGI